MSTRTRGPIRVLIAKPGLDGHDTGAKVVSLALRDAGMEVVYSGLRRTPQEIVQMALEEDVDAIGLSILSGAHIELTREVAKEMQQAGLHDVLLIVGGLVPRTDFGVLKEAGVDGIFPTGSDLGEIAQFLRQHARRGNPQTEVTRR
mgnify:CR=1 FL=1